jgi:hypothetical protein
MDYDHYNSFPPVQPISRVVSAFQRVDNANNEVASIRYVEYNGAITSEVTVQTYNKSGEVVEYNPSKNIIDLMI